MPTWEDVVAIGLSLPETEESTWFNTPSLKVKGKGFCRMRSEAEGGVVLFCDHEEKAALLEAGDPAFFTTPHYDGYPAILVNLDHVDPEVLGEMIVESWRRKAPRTLLRRFDAERGE